MNPAVVRTVADLRAAIGRWRAEGLRVAFVPTMGALHDGHLALVAAGRAAADRVVVSVFVNPTQFAAGEDFDTYPRNEAGDRARLGQADLLYAPPVAEMYPPGFATAVEVAGLDQGMCGASRPGHFRGVATVVTKLLLQVLPDVALFGEKDWQQLQIIRRLVRDLDIPVAVQGVPTVREADGLALSSRNAYLDADQRRIAGELPRILGATARDIAAGTPVARALDSGRAALAAAGFDSVDYLELRTAEDLMPLATLTGGPARLFVAARLGATRLIDNIPVMTISR